MKVLSDFHAGDRWTTVGRTVTEAHIVGFSGLTGDFYPLHTDEDYARTTEFGTRIAQGPLIFSIAVGLVSQSEVFGGAVLAYLGASDIRHLRPCPIDTTIRVRVGVISTRPGRHADRGLCVLEYVVLDSDDLTLMTAQLTFLMRAELAQPVTAKRNGVRA
ncbi:3-hydroxybutyryl-CoA dehydratase [Mycobacterium sp. MAA66]|uniref:MaoC/PaaZ C-terminal domain-containing protein n=1 Tax=Mycobacterium sp. MAA66 TaxID=3156297 RepID=UPI003511872F